MATFTKLGDADLHAIAALFELGPVASWQVIEAGTINSNYAVDTPAGRVFVRVNEGKGEADVRYEAGLVDQLASAGVPTPRPLPCATQRFAVYAGKYISAFPWLAGRHIEVAETTPGHTRAVGGALAKLHRAGDGVSVVERLGIYTFDHIVARFEDIRSRTDAVLASALGIIAEEIDWLRAQADLRNGARRGIIHGDLFRDNVLFDDDQLSGLIDFEQASTGSLAYDLAVCINAWCYREGQFDPALISGLIAGYESVRELTQGDRQALYAETRLAAMRFTVTRITDVYLAGTNAPGKDFREYLERLSRLRQVDSILPNRH